MQISNVNMMQVSNGADTHTELQLLTQKIHMVFVLRLTQIVLMNFIIYSYHGSKYGQMSGYNNYCIGAVVPQISGTKYLELTRYKKKVAPCGMNHYSQITVYSY